MSTWTLPNNELARLQMYSEEYIIPPNFNRPALRTLMNDRYLLELIKSLSADMLVMYDDLTEDMEDIADSIHQSLTAEIIEISGQISGRLDNISTQLLPIGAGLRWPLTDHIPSAFIPALGGEYSQTTYPELYAILGTSQGVASSPDKFKMPYYGYKYGTDGKMYITIIRAVI